MEKITQELNRLKKSIDEAKKSVANLQGRKDESLKRLKEEFAFTSIDSAQKWVLKAEKELQKADTEIKARFTKLKENYEW